MSILRRVATVAVLGVGLTACGSQTTDQRMNEQVDTITTVARIATGSPEEIADAVRGAPLGEYMTLEVLSSEHVEAEDVTRLNYRLHFEGWPDGFGDVPARTSCYRMDFTAGGGLVDEPVEVNCPST